MVEQFSTEIVFENDGTGARKSNLRVHVQSDAGIQSYAVLTFAYQGSSENIAIDYVRVRKPDGTLVVTPGDNVQDLASEISRLAPMYSDQREKHVAVKGLGVGDTLEYQVQWKITKPLDPGQFWSAYNFSRGGIVLQEILRISVPRERLVKWSSPKSQPAIIEQGARRIFTWTGSQLVRQSKEQEQKDQETMLYLVGRGRAPQPDVQFSSFQTWEEIGRWYSALQAERAKPTPEIQAKAAELTKSAADDRAKLQAIYNYVSRQVHYIGIELGIGRYQAHAAAEVLANQYGDCKDKHTLLASLLQAVGIQAVPVLIASIRELDPAVPSPAQFDHVISAVRLGDGLVWLDTTPEVGPLEYLPSPMRGKAALLVSADKAPALVNTPALPPVKPLQIFRIDAKLTDTGTLQGKIQQTIQGDDSEFLLRAAFRRVPVPQWKDLVQQVSYGSGFAGDVSEVTAGSPENTDEPFHFAYTYERKDYPDWSNRRVGSPLPSIVLPSFPEKDAKPVHPIWLGASAEIRYESHVELPKGYKPVLPKNLDINESFAEFHRSFEFKDGILTTERRLVMKIGEVPESEYEAYKKFAKAVTAEAELRVPVKLGSRSPTEYQSEIWDLPYSENADAIRAYDDARERAQKNDTPAALAAVKRAVEADPGFVRAWLWLGELYKFSNRSGDAIQAYRKAMDLDPQQAVSYKALGYTLLTAEKAEDAIPVFQQLIKVAPNDGAGYHGLGTSLSFLKRYREAEPFLEKAAQLNPETPHVQRQLASACLNAGDHHKALQAYRKSLELEPSPDNLNTVAYELAEANEALTVALEYTKKAVSQEGEASRKVSLAQLQNEDLVPSRLLPMIWDTLGWVYFKLGDLDQAEKYLNAAWALTQIAVVADHLGQVYERQGKKQAAVRMYKFALNRAAALPSLISEQKDKIRGRLDHISPGASAAAVADNLALTDELSHVRTTKLPAVATGPATAEFFLAFEQDPKTSSVVVGDVKFISGSEELKSADTRLKAFNFKVQLPADGQPLLLRRGVLVCYPQSGCSITMFNSQDVQSAH